MGRRSLLAVLLGFTTVAATPADGPAPPLGGRFAGSVLLSEAPLSASDLSPDLSSADRLRLLAYLDRRAAFRSRIGVVAGDAALHRRRTRLEQEIVSVIEQPGIEVLATAIAVGAPLAADPLKEPEGEAAWAESALRDPGAAPAAPYLYAFLASRYRIQLERAPDDRSALERLAKKYKTMLERARHANDSIFMLLADDLDGRASISASASRHPRQYLPDT
jgi:hypothetical protein